MSVTIVNQRSDADNDQATTNVGEPVSIDVLQNDTDLEGNDFVVSSFTQPTHGVVDFGGEGPTLFYSPQDGFVGTDSFSYTIADYFGDSSTANVTVTVEGPSLSIEDSSIEEGTGPMVFTVRLSAVSAQDVTAHFETANGTASAGTDYTATTGTVTIPAGQTTNTITVAVAADQTNEAGETFTMALSAPTNATLGAQSTATGTINDETADFSRFLEGLEGLPEPLKDAGRATVRACQALESLDPSELTEGQRNMLTSCETVAEAAAENPDQTRDAVEQLSGQQNISRLPIAFAFGTTQLTNVNARLLELRQGATGVSTTGLKFRRVRARRRYRPSPRWARYSSERAAGVAMTKANCSTSDSGCS